MSDHKTNPQAIRAATLPTLLPVGHIAGTQLSVQVAPKKNVAMFPPDRMRVGDGGQIEFREASTLQIQDGDGSTLSVWSPLPQGVIAHEMGTPLPPEQCDVVVLLGTAAQDTFDKGIVLPGDDIFSAKVDPTVSTQWHVELMRMPLVEWQAKHLAKLRGGEPS